MQRVTKQVYHIVWKQSQMWTQNFVSRWSLHCSIQYILILISFHFIHACFLFNSRRALLIWKKRTEERKKLWKWGRFSPLSLSCFSIFILKLLTYQITQTHIVWYFPYFYTLYLYARYTPGMSRCKMQN